MNYDKRENRIRLAQDEPFNVAARVRISDYLDRTGMSVPDLAERVGYKAGTLQKFLGGHYHLISGSSRIFIAAVDSFIQLHPIAPPTRVHGDLYETANVRAIRETFARVLPAPVAYVLYAPPGSQKTFVLEHEVARLNLEEINDRDGKRAFYVYARQRVKPRDLIRRVSVACGSRIGQSIDQMLNNLRFQFAGRRVLLIVDEAQHLSMDCFETLRELLDQPPYFSLLFSGSHDLKTFFDKFSATLEQWNSRIIAKVRLPGVQRDEARGILARELNAVLADQDERAQRKLIDSVIDSATVRDAYNGNDPYINIRTLTSAVRQIKAKADLNAAGMKVPQ